MKKIQKLSLNKTIVSKLTSDEARQIIGGDANSYNTCDTDLVRCPNTYECYSNGGYSCNDCPDSDNCASVVPVYC